ncbi:MAG: biotin/lipoyl-binding protein [Verrucomicrobia bacterium]|nr:biotin/lipoyl-binding protein [Verrucomicrobiota bacterium]NBU09370.1 biotin/lipoyl-binding protein [Pseudomonadota bacterium]NDA68047.1 biotin/lipoyl-binding protein [Verrucomicrobiota bacterium]NDB75448.1 biotin/lipoyl-binding protein [Verrucomicrobiota bacterium]NDD37193.1 biotin/lipoyl-binding protein [Verrucomicrobiota bacterium]
MLIFRQFTFYIALAGFVGVFLLVKQMQQKPPSPPPAVEPARSPFPASVAATGILEAVRENVKIATPKAALIQKVAVEVGSKVKAGDVILQLDDREARARLNTLRLQLGALRAALDADKVMQADAADQLARAEKLAKDNVISVDERKRREFGAQSWDARIAKSEADIKAMEAQIAQSLIELDVLTVRAPRDGSILQVNVRAGEFAGTTPTEPLVVLGEVEKLQVRAEVDEQDAPRVEANRAAVAYLKGDTQRKLPLRFVRIEPFVIPKRSLTGDSAERVDTRVLQIIFELDRPEVPVYVGQQVDVFIERTPTASAAVVPPVPRQQ